jgi:putative ABC transport system permease protein
VQPTGAGAGLLSELWQDVRTGARAIVHSPGFALTAVLSLALGIGATTTIFSVVHAVVVDPFPYKEPDRLLSLNVIGPDGRGNFSSYTIDEYVALAEGLPAFEGVIASTITDVEMTGTGTPERLRGNYVSPNTFEVMGVPPLLGRWAGPADAQAGATPVAVLGYRFWQRYFGGDPQMVGRTLRLNGTLRQVIGVMPRRFMWRGADVYVPTPYRRGVAVDGVRTVHVMGRLRPDASTARVEGELRPLIQGFRSITPERFPAAEFRLHFESFSETFASDLGPVLGVLLAAVGLLLLIACGNVSNLQLARATAREREMALRASLGASRWRLARQLLTESALLAVAGAVLGVALARFSLWAVTAVIPPGTIPDESHVRLNTPVLLFALGVAAASTLIFGLAPAWRLARTEAAQALRDGRSAGSGARHAGLRGVLVAAELALALVLLVGTGLMARTLVGMQQVSLTFDPARVLTMRLPLPDTRYPTREDRFRFISALLDRVQALPGVAEASVDSGLPYVGARGTSVTVPGRPKDDRFALVHETTERYFDIQRLTLRAGRRLDHADVTTTRRVGVVNRAFADRYFGSASPVGQTVRLDYLARPPIADPNPSVEVIGVVDDVRNIGVRPLVPEIYVPVGMAASRTFLVVESHVPPATLERAIRAQVTALDPEQPVTDVQTLAAVIDEAIYARPRFSLLLLGAFAVAGLLLAVVGVYGIMAYTVAQQRTEIGVRMALGATRRDVLGLVFGRGVRLVAAGSAAGIALAFGAAQLLRTQLWETSTLDPAAYAAVTALLTVTALAACVGPAWRAARTTPMSALRD